MSIKKQANLFLNQKLAFFTGRLTEVENKGDKPKKVFSPFPSQHHDIKHGDWKPTHIMSDHNTIVLTTGTKNQNLLLIDWDFKEWNKETQSFEFNHSVLEAYHNMVEKLGGEINTYTERTGNGGRHWIYKYDPAQLGYVIAQQNGFIYNGIKCGDIKGENGLIYTAPSRYIDIRGNEKEYEVENDMEIAMVPDMLFELIQFTKYENNAKTKASGKEKESTKITVAPVRTETIPDSGISSGSEEEINAPLPEVTQLNTEYDFVNAYLHCIDADDYKSWLDVCLSVSPFPKYHQLVHSWARQSSKYTYSETQKTISNGNGKKTIGSLYYMAMKTNKKLYFELCDSVLEKDKEFQTMLSTFNDNDISKYFFKFHKYSFVYDEATKTWYAINNKNIWETTGSYPETLKTQIIKFVVNKLESFLKVLGRRQKATQEALKTLTDVLAIQDATANLLEIAEQMKVVGKYICNIGKSTFIRNVIDMLKVYYINKTVAAYLATQQFNRHKLAFLNGLYDLDKKEFRDIEPIDYITITTGYDYIDTPNTEVLEKINKTLEEIADNTKPATNDYISDLQYLKNISSSNLYGLNKRREIYIFTGSGANSKSFFCEVLLKPAFGDYYGTMSCNFYTKADHNAGCATPELADKQYCRPMVSSEPEGDDKLQVGKIKNITGLEEIPARQLYGKLFKYVPQFTPIMLCNHIPNFNKIDKAITQRVRIINFSRKFVENPTLPFHRQLILNKHLEFSDVTFRQAFMWLLIENYKTMDSTKRSKSSIEASEEFNNVNNPILEFVRAKIVKTEEETQAKEMYSAYVAFCLEEDSKPVSNIAFSKLMQYNDFEKRTDRSQRAYWKNCSLIDKQSEKVEKAEETNLEKKQKIVIDM